MADVATQAHFAARIRDPDSNPDQLRKNATCAPWGPVYGDFHTFDDPETRLLAIDRLEGFLPGGPCLYHRVLVPAQANGSVLPAWLYVGEDPISGKLMPLGRFLWPR